MEPLTKSLEKRLPPGTKISIESIMGDVLNVIARVRTPAPADFITMDLTLRPEK